MSKNIAQITGKRLTWLSALLAVVIIIMALLTSLIEPITDWFGMTPTGLLLLPALPPGHPIPPCAHLLTPEGSPAGSRPYPA